MQIRQSYTRRRARIEIIPLIDIIFFLLATFVMVSLSMIKNQGVSVKLPKAFTGVTQERGAASTITVKENGQMYFNKEQISEVELHRRLSQLKTENPDPKVILNGDSLAYFGDVVMVLDSVRGVGIDKIAIQTKGSVQPPAEVSK